MKLFFASFLALIIFSIIALVIGVWIIGAALQPSKPDLGSKGVLVLDLSTTYNEQAKDNPLASITGDASDNAPGLYDIIRMLHYAKTDTTIKAVYIKAGYNANGYAASEELRKAILDFKESKKMVLAYGEAIDQKSYDVATAADKIYCHPNGGIDWDGFSVTLLFMKGLLDKLGIEPQVFFAGKFKSATEPFRVTKMTDANRVQTTDLLNDLYSNFLQHAATARKLDTAALHLLSTNGSIRTAYDALKYHLVDGLKYDDQIQSELLKKLGQQKKEKLGLDTDITKSLVRQAALETLVKLDSVVLQRVLAVLLKEKNSKYSDSSLDTWDAISVMASLSSTTEMGNISVSESDLQKIIQVIRLANPANSATDEWRNHILWVDEEDLKMQVERSIRANIL